MAGTAEKKPKKAQSLPVAEAKSDPAPSGATVIPLSSIVMPPKILIRRVDVGDVGTLAASIKRNGLLNPLTVRKTDGGKYELLCGHRRFAALQKIGEKSATVNVKDNLDDDTEALGVVIAENSTDVRYALSDYEHVQSVQALYDLHFKDTKDEGEAIKAVARAAGVSAKSIKRALICASSPKVLQERLKSGDISQSTILEIDKIKDNTIKERVLKGVKGDTVKTADDVRQEAVRVKDELEEAGKEVEEPEDKRSSAAGSASLWRKRGEVSDQYDQLLVNYVSAEDEDSKTLHKWLIASIAWVQGLLNDINITSSKFNKLLEREIKRVKEEYEIGGEAEAEAEEKPAKKAKAKASEKATEENEDAEGEDAEDAEGEDAEDAEGEDAEDAEGEDDAEE